MAELIGSIPDTALAVPITPTVLAAPTSLTVPTGSASLTVPTAPTTPAAPPSPTWPTDSARLREASLDAVPGPAALLRLLGSARPADVAPALAEAAGPEPVWALDLERAGSLDAVQPAVRASMAAGSAEPLIEAAKRIPRRHWLDVLDDEAFGCQMLRDEAELDRTGHFPLEALVVARLDGRPERWAEVARQVAGGRMPVEAVVAAVVESAAEPAPETPAEAAPETPAEAATQTPAASAIAALPVHAAPSASTT